MPERADPEDVGDGLWLEGLEGLIIGGMTDMNDKTSVLFVCMGNICRSPTAEGVFRKLVTDA